MRHVALMVVLLATLSSTAVAVRSTFYLALAPHECAIGPIVHKQVTVVPCSDPRHNLEVYAIGHAGWGHGPLPKAYATQLAAARRVCLAAFQRVTGRPMAVTEGWSAFWPDPGAEQARYGDKLICSFRVLSHLAPLGSGWHVH